MRSLTKKIPTKFQQRKHLKELLIVFSSRDDDTEVILLNLLVIYLIYSSSK